MKVTAAGVYDTDDRQVLSDDLRQAMLNVILIWASLDGAVSQLYVAIRGLSEVEHADDASDHPAHWKLREIQKILRPSAPEFAARFGKLKKQYEAQSKLRDTIAHCHCAGRMISEPDRAVFLRYRRIGDGLIVDAVPLEQMIEAFRFGCHLQRLALELVDRFRAAE